MDTLEFLNTVLPNEGRRCVGMLDGKVFRNFFGGSNEWATEAVKRIDGKNINSYIALGGFGEERSRKQDNVVSLRCSWLDIDTRESKPNETYANRKEAYIELLAFCKEVSLPTPLVISSGYGLHVYWVYTHDVSRQKWKQIATLLKATCERYGLAVDRSRTTDEASVLRPVGTHNFKNGNAKDVKALTRCEEIDPDDLLVILADYLDEDADMFTQSGPSQMVDINSDLKGDITYAPSSAEKIAEECGAVAQMRDTKGNLSQPEWYAGLGITSFTTEGDDLSHEWSNGHAHYNKRETDTKIAQVKQYGPTTCDKFSQLNPTICKACRHFGKIKSPISLGTSTGATQLIEVSPEDLAHTNGAPPNYPPGYSYDTPKLGKKKHLIYTTRLKNPESDEVEEVQQIITDVNLYPIARIEDKSEHHHIRLRMITDQGYRKEFTVDTHMITRGDKSIMAELGKHEIAVMGAAARTRMELYLGEWIGKLRDEYKKTPTVTQYGWHNDGLVVGQSYIALGGDQKAMVSGSAQSLAKHLVPKGSLEAWVDAVDRAYNNSWSTPLQYCMMTSFAAPLFSLFKDKGGVTVYAHSEGSGYGKTTAQLVGLSAWGQHRELYLQENNFTINALYNHMGTMCHLPVVIDELTNCENKFASDLVFSASAGKGKSRLNADGSAKDTANWSTITAASGNNLLSEKLSLHRANAESELARIFEFTIPTRSPIATNEANAIFAVFNDNYGHAGLKYARYLVDNREEVTKTLFEMREMFNLRCDIKQQERYWAALHASILTSVVICNKIGLTQFNFDEMLAWIEASLANSRGNTVQSVTLPLEQFADMLSDIWKGVLVTVGEGNLAQGLHAELVGRGPTGVITGRSIIGDRTSSEKLYISVGAAKDWCNKKGVSLKAMQEALVDAKWASPDVKRMSLGKGTQEYSALGGPVKVWEVNPSAVRTGMGDAAISAKIVGTIQGGLDDAAASK